MKALLIYRYFRKCDWRVVFLGINNQRANRKRVSPWNCVHVIGTAGAIEMGEIEGAISSLSIAVAGLGTCAEASVFSYFGKEQRGLLAMKEIKIKADKPFHNNVDVAVIDFPQGRDGEERQRCKFTVDFSEYDVKQLQNKGLDYNGAISYYKDWLERVVKVHIACDFICVEGWDEVMGIIEEKVKAYY